MLAPIGNLRSLGVRAAHRHRMHNSTRVGSISDGVPIVDRSSGPFLRIFQWRGQQRKGTSGSKVKVEKCSLWGGLGVLPQKLFVFLSSLDLISCNFSMIFAHFQTKRDITRGAKTLQWGANIGAGGALPPPPVYMLKKAL